jgi:hypothetical protein
MIYPTLVFRKWGGVSETLRRFAPAKSPLRCGTLAGSHARSAKRVSTNVKRINECYPRRDGQVVHLAQTDRYWLHDIQARPVTGLNPEDYPTRASFTGTWEDIEQELLAYVQSLTDDDLITVPDGLMETRWEALLHVVNHGTDHRSQILSMLHRLGVPTFEQDLGDYLRRQRRVSKADVLKLVRFRRGEWEEMIDAIPRERMDEPAVGEWSIKDIVAHLNWYDREMVGVLQARKLAGSEWWSLPLEERNRRILNSITTSRWTRCSTNTLWCTGRSSRRSSNWMTRI